MKNTQRTFGKGALIGGLFVAILCLPTAAQAYGWGFSFNLPFFGFQVGDPYGYYAYDPCACSPYYPAEPYYPESETGYLPPPPRAEMESDVSINDYEPIAPRNRLEGGVEERAVRYGYVEKSPPRTRPQYTAHLYPYENERVESSKVDERVVTETNPLDDPSEVEQGTESSKVPSPATRVLKSESEEEDLIPLSGVD
jgi:hypothetical protein